MGGICNAVEAGMAVAQGEVGIKDLLDAKTNDEALIAIAQLAAGFATLANSPKAALHVANINAVAALATLAKMALDAKENKPISTSDILSVTGNVVSIAIAIGVNLFPAGRAVAMFAKAASMIVGGAQLLVAGAKNAHAGECACSCPGVDPKTGSHFVAAQRFIPRRDPLILDLNSNGIETVPVSTTNPILFDHEGNGIKTGTGWVAPSDGFLVLDRNGNGTIDDGTELFGDNTPIYDANGDIADKAADGFAALAQEDTNGDGVVNAQDANFANLRVWQDLNQDGVSQDGELKFLAELGITGINVSNVTNSQLLANGNQIADLGTFTRTDGTTGTAGVTSGMADVNLASDTFHRSFNDDILVTADTATLPDMEGSGAVRNLMEAASIQSAEGATLASALSQFASATTRNAQRAQLDTLLSDWAATADFPDMATRAAEHGYTLVTNLSPAWQQKLTLLEIFNGRGFYKMPWDTLNAQSGVTGMSVGTDATGQPEIKGVSIAFNFSKPCHVAHALN